MDVLVVLSNQWDYNYFISIFSNAQESALKNCENKELTAKCSLFAFEKLE